MFYFLEADIGEQKRYEYTSVEYTINDVLLNQIVLKTKIAFLS